MKTVGVSFICYCTGRDLDDNLLYSSSDLQLHPKIRSPIEQLVIENNWSVTVQCVILLTSYCTVASIEELKGQRIPIDEMDKILYR